jgi:hypothetical protein
MSEEKRPGVAGPEGHLEPIAAGAPSELPENPSVGELVSEIDRARHEVARTAGALADKMDVRSRVEQVAGERVEQVRSNPRPIIAVAGGVLVLGLLALRARRSKK